jgi:RNA polymerase sigma factor (sigma-70 family)
METQRVLRQIGTVLVVGLAILGMTAPAAYAKPANAKAKTQTCCHQAYSVQAPAPSQQPLRWTAADGTLHEVKALTDDEIAARKLQAYAPKAGTPTAGVAHGPKVIAPSEIPGPVQQGRGSKPPFAVAGCWNYCLRRVGSWQAAEDLTSVVFLETWRRRRDIKVDGPSVRPWLYGVALGATRNHRRAAARYHAALARIPAPAASPDHAISVAERIDLETAVTAVKRELARLPRREREVVEVCSWLGLTHAEAAKVLDVPIGTVKSRLARAQRKIRDAVPANGSERSATE